MFQRGKVRKVFTVADMLRYLHERYVFEKLREGQYSSVHLVVVPDSLSSQATSVEKKEIADGSSNEPTNAASTKDVGIQDEPKTQPQDAIYTCALKSQNFSTCYQRYYECNGDNLQIEKELKDIDMAVWMSGLVCCASEECAKEFELIIPSADSGRGPLPSMKRFADDEQCPPGIHVSHT